MESKKGFGKKLEHFIEGRGFYILLVLCAAIIGVSAWSLLSGAEMTKPSSGQSAAAVLGGVTPQPTAPEITPVAPSTAPAPTTTPAAEPVPEDETASAAAQTAYVWPVEGEVLRTYSMDALQYDPTMSDWRTHDGVDIAAAFGTPVAAMASGTVTEVTTDARYGTTVVTENAGGLRCVYANLETTPTVYVGDTVAAGDTIGSVGDSAACESAQESHLHLAVTSGGESVSPLDFLPQKN